MAFNVKNIPYCTVSIIFLRTAYFLNYM